jgi:hypothetical protein
VKAVLIHYHLRAGGVTQVMLNQARTLQEYGHEVFAVCGEGPVNAGEWQGIDVGIIPALHYDRCRVKSRVNAKILAGEIERLVYDHWQNSADVPLLHVHNPLIKKNCLLIEALKLLRERFPLLLQSHDLAEDFRPDVYMNEEYPENCHYAVINSRDYRFMLEAGLKKEGLHLLPNEVRVLKAAPDLKKEYYLYPVRGIRRKNLGEALLLSAFIPHAKTTAITQRPTTERDAGSYRLWKSLAAELELPVRFEAGETLSFSQALGSAYTIITTSIKEGFGFSFLEAWTAGIAVTGRRIDYVCRDFEKNGVCFNDFYNSIKIPARYAPPELFLQKLSKTLRAVYKSFGIPLPEEITAGAKKIFGSGEALDFGVLDEEMQEAVLRALCSDKNVKKHIALENPFLSSLSVREPDHQLIEQNRLAVRRAYSRESLGGHLQEVYRAALSAVTHRIDRRALLERYLDPSRVFLTGIAYE